MISNAQPYLHAAARCWPPLALALCLLLAGCTNLGGPPRPPRFDGLGPLPPLAYNQMLAKMNNAELHRERTVLAALPKTPNTQLRMAMLFGHPRGPQDIGKALALLDGILKSNEAPAVSLHPLARLLTDNYLERQQQEGQLDRQGVQLKESQRKNTELQEKLDGLADIERTLPQRTRPVQPAAVKGAR